MDGQQVIEEPDDEHSEEWWDGWLEGAGKGIQEAERAIPPLLRRFFWWDLDHVAEDYRRKLFWRGGDEYCNDTIGIRLKGGVLFIRRNFRVRLEPHPACQKCKEPA